MTIENSGHTAPAPQADTTLADAVSNYLAAIDSEPEKDIWDTWDSKPAKGASKSASDWSWAEHGLKIEGCLADLRAALAATEGSAK